ncbi:acetyl-CoA carboxylase biotin carboxyl carrier protein [Paenibacillus sp. P36]|uniref:acetyl-CoA carboxylase biotin carboxyl carrier protein n=1 Tax=Paenibacillus sp. P36 TaxID=3342538 RepID=UPI0038B2FA3D
MLSFKEISDLIKTVDASSIEELELEKDGMRLKISTQNKTRAGVTAPTDYRPVSPVTQIQASSQEREPSVMQTADSVEALSFARPLMDVKTELKPIVSPMVGTFYHAPSPDKPAFVKVGEQVKERTVVCILEAMKLMNEIEAECAGEIVQILVENGQLVEYGQPMFLVKPI